MGTSFMELRGSREPGTDGGQQRYDPPDSREDLSATRAALIATGAVLTASIAANGALLYERYTQQDAGPQDEIGHTPAPEPSPEPDPAPTTPGGELPTPEDTTTKDAATDLGLFDGHLPEPVGIIVLDSTEYMENATGTTAGETGVQLAVSELERRRSV